MWGTVPVTFIGKTPQEEIDQLYARMDVLVAPSIWPESYGLVTREAAAAGVWVVASDIGAIGEDVIDGKTGNIVTPTTAQLVKAFASIDQSQFEAVTERKTLRTVNDQVLELTQHYREIF